MLGIDGRFSAALLVASVFLLATAALLAIRRTMRSMDR
jgi:hypothetical protein